MTTDRRYISIIFLIIIDFKIPSRNNVFKKFSKPDAKAFVFYVCDQMKDLTILLEDKPGSLAEVTKTLGNAGINIEGGCGYPAVGRGIFHILVEDAVSARNSLEAVGITISEEKDVMIIDLDNQPGAIGNLTSKFGEAGINIDLFYFASNNRIVISVDDFDKAKTLI